MELAGHDAGTNTGGAELVKPSTVALALNMAFCVVFVSLAAMTMEKETESVVTCNRLLRPLWRARAVFDVNDVVCGLRPTKLYPGMRGRNILLNEMEVQNSGHDMSNATKKNKFCMHTRIQKFFYTQSFLTQDPLGSPQTWMCCCYTSHAQPKH